MKGSAILALLAALCITGCGLDSQSKIDENFPTDTINITNVSTVKGLDFYVPDKYVDNALDQSSNNTHYFIRGDDFIFSIVKRTVDTGSEDYSILSENYSKLFKIGLRVDKTVSEDTLQGTVTENESNMEFNIRNIGDYSILSANKNPETALYVLDNIKGDGKGDLAGEYTVIVNDSDLTASINGTAIGQRSEIDSIKADFNAMADQFEKLKNETSYVNGQTISDIANSVTMNFNRITEFGGQAHQLYLASVSAYAKAVNEYEISVANGTTLMSKKNDILKNFGIDYSDDWEKIVIENEAQASPIKKVIIEYNDDLDRIENMIIEARDDFAEKKAEIENNSLGS